MTIIVYLKINNLLCVACDGRVTKYVTEGVTKVEIIQEDKNKFVEICVPGKEDPKVIHTLVSGSVFTNFIEHFDLLIKNSPFANDLVSTQSTIRTYKNTIKMYKSNHNADGTDFQTDKFHYLISGTNQNKYIGTVVNAFGDEEKEFGDFGAIGSCAKVVTDFIESKYKNNLEKNDLIKLAKEAVELAIEKDGACGGLITGNCDFHLKTTNGYNYKFYFFNE